MSIPELELPYKQRLQTLSQAFAIRRTTLKWRTRRTRIRKLPFAELEHCKKHIIDDLHWRGIHRLLESNDVIFLEDTKNHGIMKRAMATMRYHVLKGRCLEYRAY